MDLKMEASVQQILSQKMVLSAQILQMNSLELENYLKDAAVENPVIDLEDNAAECETPSNTERKLEWLAQSDEQNRQYNSAEEGETQRQDMWNVSDRNGGDLQSFLLDQLRSAKIGRKERLAAEYIISFIDASGYLTEDTEIIAASCHAEKSYIEEILKFIQKFDPAGVGARNLGECLLLQLDREGISDENVRMIAENYLEELGKNQLPLIARKLRISLEDVLLAVNVIKKLNPKPGNSFSSRENLKYIIPDVTIVKKLDGFEILLNDSMYPKITVNSYYLNMFKVSKDKQTKEYVDNKVRQAQWLIQCLDQRSSTLMRVSEVIADRQAEFFELGPGHLCPLKLADVADEVGIHESTVSRAVKEKYIQCSFGVFPMKYFFIGSLEKQGNEKSGSISDSRDRQARTGSNVTAERNAGRIIQAGTGGKGTENCPDSCDSSVIVDVVATADGVKSLIKEIIATENHKKPYSDRLIVEKLSEKGIKISRRTVAKYRESMGIKDASGRKVYE